MTFTPESKTRTLTQATKIAGFSGNNHKYALTQHLILLIPGLISLVIFMAWQIPSLALHLPDNWHQMQFATATSLLILSFSEFLKSLSFSQHKSGSTGRLLVVIFCGVLSIIIALNTLSQHFIGYGIPLNLLFVHTDLISESNLMSIQSAICVLILGILQVIGNRQSGIAGIFLDLSYLLLFAIIFIYISGYLFGVFELIGSSQDVLISSQTLIAIIFLACSAMIKRAPYGVYSVLVEKGSGSKFARISLPFAVVISYLIIMYSHKLLTNSDLSMQTSAALTAAGLATVLVVVVIFFARRINVLESHLLDITMTDELTQINNLRGFYLLGEQAHQDAALSGHQLSMYYFDLDGLKEVNDKFGHKIGSELIKSFANILSNTFNRKDVIGRLGGDEFAVIAHQNKSGTTDYIQKIHNAVNSYNKSVKISFKINFNAGHVNMNHDKTISLQDWVHMADENMYQDKNKKR